MRGKSRARFHPPLCNQITSFATRSRHDDDDDAFALFPSPPFALSSRTRDTNALRPPPLAVGNEQSTAYVLHPLVHRTACATLGGINPYTLFIVLDRSSPSSRASAMVTVTSHDAAGPANAYVTRATPLRLGLDTEAFHHSPSYAYGEPSAARIRGSSSTVERSRASSRAMDKRMKSSTAESHAHRVTTATKARAAWTNGDVRGALVEASDAMDRAARGMSARGRVERRVVMLWGRGAAGRVGTRSSTPEEPRRAMMNECVLFWFSHREKA